MSKLSGLKPPSKIGKPSALATRQIAGTSSNTTIKALNAIAASARAAGLSATAAEKYAAEMIYKLPAPEPTGPSTPSDDFIIGDRVYVGGTKPGFIAYLGETRFAPGDWAGVVLDEPIGKNDGSVAGVRYFQCEPKRGVFSRPTKLTRMPSAGGAGVAETPATASRPSVTGSGLTRSVQHTNGGASGPSGVKPTPGPTIRTVGVAKRMPSLSTSNTSLHKAGLTTNKETAAGQLSVGDRVFVSGTKPGTLRYIGATDFAKGEWAGVELDDPLGKNDGAVAGKRYFDCQPIHGLFAPVHKVTKVSGTPTASGSPRASTSGSPRMTPGNVTSPRIRLGMSASPRTGSMTRSASGLSRDKSGSMESVSSVTSSVSTSSRTRVRLGVTSITSSAGQGIANKTPKRPGTLNVTSTNTALQKALKEKDEHIDQLLKEREIDRSEVIRAAALIDEAENETRAVRSTHEKYVEEREDSLQTLKGLLEESDRVKVEIAAQLDEERRKVEDLQFKVEEAEISKDDILESNQDQTVVRELEAEVQSQARKIDALQYELTTMKANYGSIKAKWIVSEEDSTKYLDQVEELTHNVYVSENKMKALLENNQLSGAQADQANEEISQKSSHIARLEEEILRHQRAHSDLDIKLNDAKEEMENVQNKRHKQEETIDELMTKLTSSGTSSSELTFEVQDLNTQLSDVQRQLAATEDRCQLLDEDKSKLEAQLSEMMKHSGDSSQQLSLMNEQINEKNRKLEELHASLSVANQSVGKLQETIACNARQYESDTETLVAKSGEDLKAMQEQLREKESELDKVNTKLVKYKERHEQEFLLLTERKDKEISLKLEEWKKERNVLGGQINALATDKSKLERVSEQNETDRNRIQSELKSAQTAHTQLEVRVRQLMAERDRAITDKTQALQIKEEVSRVKEKLSTEWESLLREKAQMSAALNEKSSKLTAIVGEVEKLRQEWAKQKAQLDSARMESQEEMDNIGTLHTQLEALKTNVERNETQLQMVEVERNALKSEVDRLRMAETQKIQLESENKSMRIKLEEMSHRGKEISASLESLVNDSQTLQHTLESTELLVKQQDQELANNRNQISSLQEKANLLSICQTRLEQSEQDRKQFETRVVGLEKLLSESLNANSRQEALQHEYDLSQQEKKALEDRVFELEEAVIEAQAAAESQSDVELSGDERSIKMKEEKESFEGQVDFLNSVIVDMQKKNEELKYRLVAMEDGVFNGTGDISIEDQSTKRVAPRLFCDICDEFDLHETDDCPTQGMSDSPPPSLHHGTRGEQRPYCDICEAFGHATHQCDDEQTF